MTPDDLSEAIRDLDLPAAGPKLQEVRDSIRAAYEFLHGRGSATRAEFEAEVYPEFASSHLFDDETADSWWEQYAAPGFEQLPNVERADGEWRSRPDR